MTPVQPRPFIEHVVSLRGFRVAVALRGAVGIDVGADVAEEVRAVAGCGEQVFEAREFRAVLLEDLAVAG